MSGVRPVACIQAAILLLELASDTLREQGKHLDSNHLRASIGSVRAAAAFVLNERGPILTQDPGCAAGTCQHPDCARVRVAAKRAARKTIR